MNRPDNPESRAPHNAVVSPPPTGASERVAPILRSLERLRAAARRRLIFQSIGSLVAIAITLSVILGVADYYLRMPAIVRGAFWGAGFAVLVLTVRRRVPPAWKFRPTLTEMALRLESTPDGRKSGLAGVVASALDLARSAGESGRRGELSALAVEDAVSRLASIRPRAVLLEPARTRRIGGAILLALACAAAISGIWPQLARIGAARVLTPWTAAAWPKRTQLVDAYMVAAHPNTTALPLRALLTRTSHAPGKTDVTVRYRIVVNGKAGAPQRALLTSQGHRAAGEFGADGELFERLFEPAALTGGAAAAGSAIELEYYFETDDDNTDPRRIALVDAPAVSASIATVTPPAYAADVLGKESSFARGQRDLGPGTDERAVVSPALAGSRVVLELMLNKKLPAPVTATREFIAERFPGAEALGDLHLTIEPRRWTLEFTLTRSLRLPVVLTDEYDLKSTEEAVYRFDAVEDRAPTVTVIEPAQDEAVLATATVPGTAEGRDDVALKTVTLEVQRATPPAGSVGAGAEATGEPVVVADKTGWDPAEPRTTAKAAANVELAPMNLKSGEEVWLTGVAADTFESPLGTHAPVRSGARKLRIISQSEMVEQVRSELAGVRDAAMRLEQEQSRLSSSRPQAAQNPAAAGEQKPREGAIKDRIGPLDDVVRRQVKRLERNNLDDKELRGLLKDAGDALESASQAAGKAQEDLNQLADANANEQQRRQKSDDLAADQKQVEDDLTQLANMLDRGEDSWAVRRTLEKLLTEQKQLASQTQNAGQGNQGQDPASLPQNQREELDRIAKRQDELAQRAAAAVEALDQRGKQMKQADPGQAQAMEQAAKRAREQQLESNQRDAAEKVKQNQTGQAQQMQQEAAKALEQMIQDLDNMQQERDQALRRLLAELADQIKALVKAQQGEITALTRGLQGAGLAGLDAGMVRLNRDTLAVHDRIAEQMKDAETLGDLITAAAEAQSSAVQALRLIPTDGADADEHERISLSRLREALTEIERLQQQAQQKDANRKRGELLKAYRQALEEQIAVVSDTAPLLGKELDRRGATEARKLGAREEALKTVLDELKSRTAELSEAPLFEYAHQRLDRTLDGAAAPLKEGTAPDSVARDESSALAVLKSLVGALREAEQQKKDFRDPNSGGQQGNGQQGGGQQQQPLIPPIAQLRLLRMLQSETADRTRGVDNKPADVDMNEVSSLQRDLANMAAELLKKMNEQNGNGRGRPGEPMQ